MPTEPVQITILENIRTALTEIVAGADYFNTLTADQVHVGRAKFDETDTLPFVSILEAPIPPEQMKTSKGGAILAGKWELFVQGFVKDGAKSEKFLTKDAYRLKQDVVTRLLQEREKLNVVGMPQKLFDVGNIEDIDVGRGVVRPDDERSGVCFFWTPLTINLVGG
jgi:hypothetical protein